MGGGYSPRLDALQLDVQYEIIYHRTQAEEAVKALVRVPEWDRAMGGNAAQSHGTAVRSLTHDIAELVARSNFSIEQRDLWVQQHRVGARTAARWADLLRHLKGDTLDTWEQLGILTDEFVVTDKRVRWARAIGEISRLLERFAGKGVVNGAAKQDEVLSYLCNLGHPGYAVTLGVSANGDPFCVPAIPSPGAVPGTLVA